MELYGNASQPVPKDFYVSCPFSGAVYEGSPYRLEYLAIGKNYAHSGRYVFHVPQYESIGGSISRLSRVSRGLASFVNLANLFQRTASRSERSRPSCTSTCRTRRTRRCTYNRSRRRTTWRSTRRGWLTTTRERHSPPWSSPRARTASTCGTTSPLRTASTTSRSRPCIPSAARTDARTARRPTYI